MNRFVFIVCVPLLASCGVIPPQISYQPYSASAEGTNEFGYPFRHRHSLLLIKQESNSFKIEVAPSELDKDGNFTPMYLMSGNDNFRAVTQLKFSYLDNTKLPDKIDVTTKDNVVDTINKIGTTAAALAPLVATVVSGSDGGVRTAPAFKPTVLNPAEAKPGQWMNDEINNGYCLMMDNISVEPGVSVADYVARRSGRASADYPVPSCATAIVHIAQCSEKESATRLRVVFAAYDKVTPMPLPSTGSLKMNSVCGATVTEADKQDRTELTTYLQTLITNVNNVKAAAKKK